MIQPMDIRSQSFKKGLFGYKPADVDSFKDSVSRAYEEAFNDNAKLKEEVESLKKLLEEKNLQIFELEKKLNGDKDGKNSGKDAKNGKNDKNDKKGGKNGADDKGAKDDSATSKFFEKAQESTVLGGDDDEVFTGDVEEARKPGKAMIGDGEEEGGDDFTFL